MSWLVMLKVAELCFVFLCCQTVAGKNETETVVTESAVKSPLTEALLANVSVIGAAEEIELNNETKYDNFTNLTTVRPQIHRTNKEVKHLDNPHIVVLEAGEKGNATYEALPTLDNPFVTSRKPSINPLLKVLGPASPTGIRSSDEALLKAGILPLPGRDPGLSRCRREATCEPLQFGTCFGVTLPYQHTSVALVNNATNQTEIQRQLQLWQGLRSVPRCWLVIQPLLCAVYMPRCENGFVDLPSQELCRVTRGPCRIVASIEGWPDYLKCDNQPVFSYQCKNDWRELASKFNSSAGCPSPLVETDHVLSWFAGVDGCGMPCQNPFFTQAEHHHIRTFVGILGSICIACCLFTIVTFFIDWRAANKYPALIVFYINCCFLIISIGWMAQFSPRAREDIVCRKDGTLRLREPSSGENLSCVIVFVMVYYFIMASVVWFVMLTYSWFIAFRALGKVREAIEAKTAYFHLVAWSLPLVLTIAVLALGQIDGDSVSGICFVGSSNFAFRVTFVLVPVVVALCCGGFFLGRGLAILISLKVQSSDIINEKAASQISKTIFRLASFFALAILLVLITIICHVYEHTHQEDWLKHFKEHMLCKAMHTASSLVHDEPSLCSFENRPSIHIVQLHLMLVFGTGIIMSLWVWTPATVDTWKRFFRRLLRQPTNEPVKLKKHKMIAKAFARRQDIQNGHLSISFYSTHDDPLGMNFDMNSAASQELSSTWAANIPKFVTRRGARVGAGPLGLKHNSSASDMSTRRGSLELFGGRRHSLDSQISLRVVEEERLAYLAQARQQRRLKKKELKRRGGHGRSEPFSRSRRNSDASQLSLPERKPNNLEKGRVVPRPSTAFSPQPQQSQLPILAPLRSHQRTSSLTGSKAADELLRLGTSSGEDLPALFLPGQVNADDRSSKRSKTKFPKGHHRTKSRQTGSRRNSYSTDNESVRNFGERISDAIMGMVYGSRTSLERNAGRTSDVEAPIVQAKAEPISTRSPAIELKTVSPSPLNNTQPSVATISPVHVPRVNNLQQYPLLSRTTIDIDEDSDIRESSSS